MPELAAVKRRVDVTNQLRNDLVEDLDTMLLGWLGKRGLAESDGAAAFRTPGLIIDRLSILSLKIFHTREEAERSDAPEGHGERNHERLAILEKQRETWRDALRICGRRSSKARGALSFTGN